MKVIKIVLRGFIAFLLGLFFCFVFIGTFSSIFEILGFSIDFNMDFIYSLIIILLPTFLFVMTIITEIKINSIKIEKKLKTDIKSKYNLDKKDIKKECFEYFDNYIKYLYYNDDTGMKRLLSDKFYDQYIIDYEKIIKKRLGNKYELLDYKLTNFDDNNGIILLDYDFIILQGISLFNRFVINKRKLMYYRISYSYMPIINQKNCHNCGAVLKNTYKCFSCGNLLKYNEHVLKIEKIEIIKEIDRWC